MAVQNCPNCNKPYEPGDEVCRYCGFTFPFSTSILPVGTLLRNRYEIQELIHSGGMGFVYLTKDKNLFDRLCVIKQVRDRLQSREHQEKLEEEALRMAKLNHPNVAMILDHFVEDDYYFLVVEHIRGKTLSEVFEERNGILPETEVLQWAKTICDVLIFLHAEGVIHRDISPDNIMLTPDGSIKFIDFGTLRELREVTAGGTAGMGKFGFSPPEQWQGKPAPRSDIFALGATIYYLLTGFLPHSKEYRAGKGPQRADFYPDFPPITEKNSDISIQFEEILQKALPLDIDKRYASASDMQRDINDLLALKTKRISIIKDTKRKLFKWRTYVVAATVILVLGCIGAGVYYLVSDTGSPEAQMIASTTSGQAPLGITFTNESKNADQFQWDLGDGVVTTTTNVKESVTHTYTKAGIHTMTLTVFKNGESMESNTATLTITVEHGVLDHIKINPDTLELEVNGSQKFTAEVLDVYNNPISEAKLTWEVEEGVGSITDNGFFTAGEWAGVFDAAITATAILDDHSARITAPVTVNHGPIDKVKVNPSTVTLKVGQSQQFTAEAIDAYGNLIPEAQLTWEVAEGAGSIAGNGIYTAGTGTSEVTIAVTAELNDRSVSAIAIVSISEWINKPMAYLGMNTKAPQMFADKRVRIALSLCIDRDEFTKWVRDTYSNEAQKVLSIVSPTVSNTNINPDRDIDTAMALMAEAGYPDGFKIKLYVRVEMENIAEKIATYLLDLGIETQIIVQINSIDLTPSSSEESYLFLTNIPVNSPETSELLGRLLLSNSEENLSGFSSSSFDQLFNSGLFREAEDIAFGDNYNSVTIIPLYWNSR